MKTKTSKEIKKRLKGVLAAATLLAVAFVASAALLPARAQDLPPQDGPGPVAQQGEPGGVAAGDADTQNTPGPETDVPSEPAGEAAQPDSAPEEPPPETEPDDAGEALEGDGEAPGEESDGAPQGADADLLDDGAAPAAPQGRARLAAPQPAAAQPAAAGSYPARYSWATPPTLPATVVAAGKNAQAGRVEAVLPEDISAKSVALAFTQAGLGHVITAMGTQSGYPLDIPAVNDVSTAYIVNNSEFEYTVKGIYIDPATVFHATFPLNLSAAMVNTIATDPAYAGFYAANQTAVDAIIASGDAGKNGGKALVVSLAADMAVPGGPDGYTRLVLDTYAPNGLNDALALDIAGQLMVTGTAWSTMLFTNYQQPLGDVGANLLTDLAGGYARESVAVRFGPEKVYYAQGKLPDDCPYLLKNYFPNGLAGETLAAELGEEASVEQGENILHISAQNSGPRYTNTSGLLPGLPGIDVGFYVLLERVGGEDDEEDDDLELIEDDDEPGPAPGDMPDDPPQPGASQPQAPQPGTPAPAAQAQAPAAQAQPASLPTAREADPPARPPAQTAAPPADPPAQAEAAPGAVGTMFMGMPGQHWALADLLLLLATLVPAVWLLPRLVRRTGRPLWPLAALLSLAVAAVVFLLTQNLRLPMAVVDRYTPVMLLLALLSLLALLLARRGGKATDDELPADEG